MNKTTITLPGMGNYYVEEAIKVLRTNLQFCGQDVRAITVTSCEMNEGKSTITLHMALSMAALGKKVLVVDADMRKSVIAGRNTDATNVRGLSEVLTGINTLNDCLYETQYDNLHVLFAGKYPPNPVELLDGQYFRDLISDAKQHYDYIFVDAPPLGMVIDAAVIATSCDSAVIVIGSNRIRYAKAKEVAEQLKKSGCRILGVILNKVNRRGIVGGTYGRYYNAKYGKYSTYSRYGEYGITARNAGKATKSK
ncbi:MAG: CpsD/CapB family tyrosine-protein kinase [Clostridia bacterium]|nr:CpsD/CapB family tyrosine-protein kinase [Clostridia bacterium]